MSAPLPSDKKPAEEPEKLKIYLLPNLFTAGNLFCGFLALTKIVEADLNGASGYHEVKLALLCILVACILDLWMAVWREWVGLRAPSAVSSIPWPTS